MAAALLKQGPGKDTGVVLEYHVNRHSNECTHDWSESRLRLHGDGGLSLLITRSHAEDERFGPGSFRGRIGKARWDSVFTAISRMKRVEAGLLMPMPGIHDANQVLMLKRGGRTADLNLTGGMPPSQELLAAGFEAASGLLREARQDTLWSLGLAGRVQRDREGRASLRAAWILRGGLPVRIRLPSAAEPPACPSMEMRSHPPIREEEGVTPLPPEIRRSTLRKAPRGALAWKDIRPGDSLLVDLDFGSLGPDGQVLEARLVHSGLPVVSPVTGDTLALVTLFSRAFRF
jgi:hypothetical protein